MTKYWKTVVQDGDSDVTLYTFTNEECIQRDRAAGPSASLIHFGASGRFQESTNPNQEHIDLAAGAFSNHRDQRGYRQSNLIITEVESMPEALPRFEIGGLCRDGHWQVAMCVYEHRAS